MDAVLLHALNVCSLQRKALRITPANDERQRRTVSLSQSRLLHFHVHWTQRDCSALRPAILSDRLIAVS